MALGIGISGPRGGGGGATPPTLTIGVYSDAGLTTAITTAVYGETVYFNILASTPAIVTTYGFALPNDILGTSYNIVEQATSTYTWVIDKLGTIDLRAYILTSTSATATDSTPFSFTITPIALVTDASTIARYSFEDNANLVFNGSTISQANDLSGNGYHLPNINAAQQPAINSGLSNTGRQFARFTTDQLFATFTPTNYPDTTMVFVFGCDGNAGTTRTGNIFKTGENDFNGASSIAITESIFQKSPINMSTKLDRFLSVLIVRIRNGVGIYSDFFTADNRQLSITKLNASMGTIEWQNVNMGKMNVSGINWAEWHIIGRSLSDAEVTEYGNYMADKWIR
jgi:hypothetical protein